MRAITTVSTEAIQVSRGQSIQIFIDGNEAEVLWIEVSDEGEIIVEKSPTLQVEDMV